VVSVWSTTLRCTATKIGTHRFLTSADCAERLALGPGVHIELTNDLLDFPHDPLPRLKIANAWVHPTALQDSFEPPRNYDVAIFDLVESTPRIPFLPVVDHPVDGAFNAELVGYSRDEHRAYKRRQPMLGVGSLEWNRIGGSAILAAFSKPYRSLPVNDSGMPVLYREASGAVAVLGVLRNDTGTALAMATDLPSLAGWMAQPEQNRFDDGSQGLLLSAKSNLCASRHGLGPNPTTRVYQTLCDPDSISGRWILHAAGNGLFQLEMIHKCLAVENASNSDGAPVIGLPCDPVGVVSHHQAWRFEWHSSWDGVARYRLRNLKSGKCLGIEGASTGISAKLAQYTCSNVLNQGWTYVR
jgi:hypothetical protein